MRLDLCDYCNRVYEVIRADKATCDNNCASKLISSRKLGRQTPKELYEQLYGGGGELKPMAIKPELKNEIATQDSGYEQSEKYLSDAKEKLRLFNIQK